MFDNSSSSLEWFSAFCCPKVAYQVIYLLRVPSTCNRQSTPSSIIHSPEFFTAASARGVTVSFVIVSLRLFDPFLCNIGSYKVLGQRMEGKTFRACPANLVYQR